MHTYYFSVFKGITSQGLSTLIAVLFGHTYSLLPSFFINAPRFLFQDFPTPQNQCVSDSPTGVSSSVQSCSALSLSQTHYFRDLGNYSYLLRKTGQRAWMPARRLEVSLIKAWKMQNRALVQLRWKPELLQTLHVHYFPLQLQPIGFVAHRLHFCCIDTFATITDS